MDGGFRVGPCWVEPGLNILSRNGATAHLEPKVMEVLVCLARHAGESISKEKLLQAVWSDSFVSDDVLTRSIYELRRVFEDDAREPRFIQTIPKRGYRLIAPVEWSNGNGGARSCVTQLPTPARLLAVGTVLVLLSVLTVGGLQIWLAGAGTLKNPRIRGESSHINGIPPDPQPKRPTAVARRDPKLEKQAHVTSGLEQGRGISPQSGVGNDGTLVASLYGRVESTHLQSLPPDAIKKWVAGIPPLMYSEFADQAHLTPAGNAAPRDGDSRHVQAVVNTGPSPVEFRVQNIPPDVVKKRITRAVLPVYPEFAKQDHVTGTVEIGLAISPRGDVGNARVLIGHPMLVTAALEAIRQWRFQPNVAQGELTWSRMRALVRFNADGTTAVAFARPLLADSFGDARAPRDELSEAATSPIVIEAR